MVPVWTTKFDLDSASADFKKLVLTDTFDYVAAGYVLANVTGYWKITNPAGLVIHEGNFTTPDMVGATADYVLKVDLSLISSDPVGFLLGKYTIEYFVKIDLATDEFWSSSIEYTFSPPTTLVDATTGEILSGDLGSEVKCFCNQIILTDSTEYGVYTTISRLLTLHPPTLAAAADQTSTGSTLTHVFTVNYASYEYHLSTLLTYVDGSVTLSLRITDDEYQIVRCTKLSAALIACYALYSQAWLRNVSDTGGKPDNSWTVDMMQLVVLWNEYNAQLQLGNWARVDALYTLIERVINERVICPCACSDDEEPTIVDPYCGVGAGEAATYTFQKISPVTVSVVGSVVTYGLETSFTDRVYATYNALLTSTDNSVSIGIAISGYNKTYDLTVGQFLAFNVLLQYTAGNDISVTVTDLLRQGTRYLAAFGANKIQVINYPHASALALFAEPAVIFFNDFLTTGIGVDYPDKIDIAFREFIPAGAAEDDYSQLLDYRMEIKHISTTGFKIQFFTSGGLPVTVGDIFTAATSIMLTVKINE